MFKVNNKNTRTTPFWCFYYELSTYFIPCSSASIVNFERVNAGWESDINNKSIPLPIQKEEHYFFE